MTDNKWGLVEDGEKDETPPHPASPGLFLPPGGLIFLMGFLGGERGGVPTLGQCPKFDSRWKTFKEKKALYTPARTGAYPHNKSPHLLISSLDLEGRAKMTFDALR